MYNPVNDNSLMVPNFSSKCKGVIWDLNDHNFFISVEPG